MSLAPWAAAASRQYYVTLLISQLREGATEARCQLHAGIKDVTPNEPHSFSRQLKCHQS